MNDTAKLRSSMLAIVALITELATDIVDHGAGDEQEMSLIPKAQDVVKSRAEVVEQINKFCDTVDEQIATLEAERKGARDAGDLLAQQLQPDTSALSSTEAEIVRRHREAEASRPETPKVWAGAPGEANGNPDDVTLLEVGARVVLLPPSKGRLNVDCSALRIELTPDDKPVPGVVIAKLKRARYHDEQDTIEVDFDSHGRAVVDALRIRFVSAPV